MVTLRFLLDTNALSEPLRPHPHPGFLRKLSANKDRFAIAATTWHEALFGLHRMPLGKRRQRVHEYLFDVIAPAVPILPYNDSAAEWHAPERVRLGARGRALPFADGQIVAIAKVHGLSIVTANVADFALFDGIAIEDWRA